MNPFEEFVSNESDAIDSSMTIIGRHEEKQDSLADKYVADITTLKSEIMQWETAFKDTIVWYNTQLPQGWHVTGNFDDWLKGKACVSFINGTLFTEAKDVVKVGGGVSNMKELQYRMDRVVRFVNKL